MALKLYCEQFDSTSEEVDGVNTKITAYHDAIDGSYSIENLYVTNDPPNLGYANIEISVDLGNPYSSSIMSEAGIVYQLVATYPGMDINSILWESLPYNNSVYLQTITPEYIVDPETEEGSYSPSYRYFLLRTYVPKGMGVNYITEASLKISAVEFQEDI